MGGELPYTITATDPEGKLNQIFLLIQELFSDYIAGARVGDVFSVDSNDILTLEISSTGGLDKSSNELIMKLKSTGGVETTADGLGIKLASGSGLSLSSDGLTILDSHRWFTNVLYPDPDATDHGDSSETGSIAKIMVDHGYTEIATMVLRHTRDSTTTTYDFATNDMTNDAIGANITLVIEPGAVITDSANLDLYILGTLVAPRETCFTWNNGGNVYFNLSATTQGEVKEAIPEWWGAIPDGGSSATDCADAINAAIQSFKKFGGIVQLGSGLYSIGSTLNVEKGTMLRGIGYGFEYHGSETTMSALDDNVTGTWICISTAIIGIEVTEEGWQLRDFAMWWKHDTPSASWSPISPVVYTGYTPGISLKSTGNTVCRYGKIENVFLYNPYVGIMQSGINIVDTPYKWTASGSGTSEYYLELSGGGNPSFTNNPEMVLENGAAMKRGTIGSLAAGEFAHGNNDALGYNTIYVRLADSADPDNKASHYVEALYSIYNISFEKIEGQPFEVGLWMRISTAWCTYTDIDFGPKWNFDRTAGSTAEEMQVSAWGIILGENGHDGSANDQGHLDAHVFSKISSNAFNYGIEIRGGLRWCQFENLYFDGCKFPVHFHSGVHTSLSQWSNVYCNGADWLTDPAGTITGSRGWHDEGDNSTVRVNNLTCQYVGEEGLAIGSGSSNTYFVENFEVSGFNYDNAAHEPIVVATGNTLHLGSQRKAGGDQGASNNDFTGSQNGTVYLAHQNIAAPVSKTIDTQYTAEVDGEITAYIKADDVGDAGYLKLWRAGTWITSCTANYPGIHTHGEPIAAAGGDISTMNYATAMLPITKGQTYKVELVNENGTCAAAAQWFPFY